MKLHPVPEGIKAACRVLAVQPEIQGEMVARAGADHQERKVVLRRNAGHQRLGSVPTGDAEQIGPAFHGLPGQRVDVHRSRSLKKRHLGAEFFRLPLEVELHHLAPAGTRIHHQESMLPSRGGVLGHGFALTPFPERGTGTDQGHERQRNREHHLQ